MKYPTKALLTAPIEIELPSGNQVTIPAGTRIEVEQLAADKLDASQSLFQAGAIIGHLGSHKFELFIGDFLRIDHFKHAESAAYSFQSDDEVLSFWISEAATGIKLSELHAFSLKMAQLSNVRFLVFEGAFTDVVDLDEVDSRIAMAS